MPPKQREKTTSRSNVVHLCGLRSGTESGRTGVEEAGSKGERGRGEGSRRRPVIRAGVRPKSGLKKTWTSETLMFVNNMIRIRATLH